MPSRPQNACSVSLEKKRSNRCARRSSRMDGFLPAVAPLVGETAGGAAGRPSYDERPATWRSVEATMRQRAARCFNPFNSTLRLKLGSNFLEIYSSTSFIGCPHGGSSTKSREDMPRRHGEESRSGVAQ